MTIGVTYIPKVGDVVLVLSAGGILVCNVNNRPYMLKPDGRKINLGSGSDVCMTPVKRAVILAQPLDPNSWGDGRDG